MLRKVSLLSRLKILISNPHLNKGESQLLFPEFASFLITYLLYWKGNFDRVRKTEHTIFTALGVTLPFVDAVETWIGFELEGNPVLTILTPPQHMWPIFIAGHIGLSILMFILSRKGKSQKEVFARTNLGFCVIFWAILSTMNALLLRMYGVF